MDNFDMYKLAKVLIVISVLMFISGIIFDLLRVSNTIGNLNCCILKALQMEVVLDGYN